jgi:ABC-type antimicrobial peptide transport system permease subunit
MSAGVIEAEARRGWALDTLRALPMIAIAIIEIIFMGVSRFNKIAYLVVNLWLEMHKDISVWSRVPKPAERVKA